MANRKRPKFIGVWLADAGLTVIDQQAKDAGLVKADGKPNRSEMIRRLLAYATRHMPKGWTP